MTSPTLDRAMSEEDLLIAVTGALTRFKWMWVHHRRSDRAITQGHPGIPDIIAARAGKVLFLELKRESGKTTPAQDAWLSELSGPCGNVTVEVVRPSDLDEVLGWLR